MQRLKLLDDKACHVISAPAGAKKQQTGLPGQYVTSYKCQINSLVKKEDK